MRVSLYNVAKVTEKMQRHPDFVSRDIIIEDENENKIEIVLFTEGQFVNVMTTKVQTEGFNA
jgi:hypothetical protein